MSEEAFSEYCFEVVTPTRTWFLSSATRVDMQDWIQSLRRYKPDCNNNRYSFMRALYVTFVCSNHVLEPYHHPHHNKNLQKKVMCCFLTSLFSHLSSLSSHSSHSSLSSHSFCVIAVITLSQTPAEEVLYKSKCQLVSGLDVIMVFSA